MLCDWYGGFFARKGSRTGMARTVGVGIQCFDKIIEGDYFYIDKTGFIKEWWESGYGRYDVMLEPRNCHEDAYILEFKVFQANKEKNLEETVKTALKQIEEKQYTATLETKGITKECIHKYGFAFDGKRVLIG